MPIGAHFPRVAPAWFSQTDVFEWVPTDDSFWGGFSRGFMLEYRSVVHGPAPWSENLGRRVQQTLGGLGDWAEAGTYVIPLGRVGLFAARGTGIVACNGTRIIGFTRHGVDRAIGDAAKRAGTRPQAILDALKNPTREIVEGIDKLGRPFQIFRGADARVIVNPQTGLIVSTNPLSALGAL